MRLWHSESHASILRWPSPILLSGSHHVFPELFFQISLLDWLLCNSKNLVMKFSISPQMSVPCTTEGSALWAGNHGCLLVVLWNLQYRGPFALTLLSSFLRHTHGCLQWLAALFWSESLGKCPVSLGVDGIG